MHAPQFGLLLRREFWLLAAQSALRPRDGHVSRVLIRSRSTSNSAKASKMLKNIFPIGSVGS